MESIEEMRKYADDLKEIAEARLTAAKFLANESARLFKESAYWYNVITEINQADIDHAAALAELV